MDNPNPIYYKDLITPDNSVTTLIAQLEQLIATYNQLRGDLQTQAGAAAKSMQSLSGATEEQRKEITLLTEQSDKLLKEYEDSTATLDSLKKKYNDGNLALREFTKIQKLVDEVNRSAEGSYNKLSAQYRLNKIRLNEMSAAQRAGTEAGRKLEAETKAIYEQMNNLQKATGKAQLQVGQYERALGGAIGVGGKWLEVLTDSDKAMETFRGVLGTLATPIGAIIGVVGAAVGVFKLWKESVNSTQATGDELKASVAEWKGGWEAFTKAVATMDFRGFITGAAEAAAAGRNLTLVLDELFERSNSTRILRASMSEENAVLQETMRDTRKTYGERLAAADQYLANMKPIYDLEVSQAKDARDAQLEYLFAVTNRTQYATKKEREAAKERLATFIKTYDINKENIQQAREYIKAEAAIEADEKAISSGLSKTAYQVVNDRLQANRQLIAGMTAGQSELVAIVKQYNLTNDEQVDAYVKAEEKLGNARGAAYNDQKRIVTMRNTLEAQQTKEAQANAKARIKATEEEAKAKAKAEEEARKEAEKAAKEEIANQRALLQAQSQSISLQISVTKEGTEEMLALRIAAIEKQREIEIFENKQKTEQLRQDEKAINAKYDAMVLKTNADFRTQLAQRDLKAAQDLAEAEFALLNKNERQKTLFRLQQEKARLEAALIINKTAAEKMTETEVAAIKKTIEGIDQAMKSLGYNNLVEVLGLELNSQQQNALNTALGSVQDSLGSLIDSWKQVADAAANAAKTQVDSAQKALDAEIEARNNGYANNVQMAQKELDLSRKSLATAQKEQEKAQKAQLALDTVTQASSLITASANIWKAFGEWPPVAIAALATMWGSFLAAKVKAWQVAGAVSSEQYGEGTVELLQGGSHASGHDIDMGTKSDGTRRRAEGGEYFAIINKRNSRKFRSLIPDVINSFNDGTFADKYQRANETMGATAVNIIAGGSRADLSGIEKNVEAIRKQGDESRYVDATGTTVVQYKNLTRKIKS